MIHSECKWSKTFLDVPAKDVVFEMVKFSYQKNNEPITIVRDTIWAQAAYAHQHLGIGEYHGAKITSFYDIDLCSRVFNYIAEKRSIPFKFKFDIGQSDDGHEVFMYIVEPIADAGENIDVMFI